MTAMERLALALLAAVLAGALGACAGNLASPWEPPAGSGGVFRDGYVDGCRSGYRDAGRDGFDQGGQKDDQRYARETDYRAGFDRAYRACFEDEKSHPKVIKR